MAPRGPGLLLAVVLTAALGFLAIGPVSASPPPPPLPTFEPGAVMCFESLESTDRCDGDTSPGAPTDIRLTFCTGWNDDCSVLNLFPTDKALAAMVIFTPFSWEVPEGNSLPVGALAGRLEEQNSSRNPCGPGGTWTMLNASIDVNDTIAPKPEGEVDGMRPLAMDADANGIPDGADKYPTFLAEQFSASSTPIQPRSRLFGVSQIGRWVTRNILFFEPGTSMKLAGTVLRFNAALGYPGVVVAGDSTGPDALGIADFCSPTVSELVILGRTLDNPCTPTSIEGADCSVTTSRLPAFRGGPAFPCDEFKGSDEDKDHWVNDGCPQYGPTAETGPQCGGDLSDDVGEDGYINDGCPAVGEVSEGERIPGACSEGDEGGCMYRSNPLGARAYTFTVLAVSQRDADGDGIENGLDVCFGIPNPDLNPRFEGPKLDPDKDGIPSVCDPLPGGKASGSPSGCGTGDTGPDDDQDCYNNKVDNCPTTAQLRDPTKPPKYETNRPFAPDRDGDGIGDACDPDPNAPTGDNVGYCFKFGLNVGGPSGPVVQVQETRPWPGCAGYCSECLPQAGGPLPRDSSREPLCIVLGGALLLAGSTTMAVAARRRRPSPASVRA